MSVWQIFGRPEQDLEGTKAFKRLVGFIKFPYFSNFKCFSAFLYIFNVSVARCPDIKVKV
jgi:hypothetical protein